MGLTALKTNRMLLNHGIFRLPSNKSSQYEVSPPSPEMSWKRTYFLQVASEINGDHIPSSQRCDNWKMSWKVSFNFDINQKLNLTSSCPAIECWCHLQSAWEMSYQELNSNWNETYLFASYPFWNIAFSFSFPKPWNQVLGSQLTSKSELAIERTHGQTSDLNSFQRFHPLISFNWWGVWIKCLGLKKQHLDFSFDQGVAIANMNLS